MGCEVGGRRSSAEVAMQLADLGPRRSSMLVTGQGRPVVANPARSSQTFAAGPGGGRCRDFHMNIDVAINGASWIEVLCNGMFSWQKP